MRNISLKLCCHQICIHTYFGALFEHFCVQTLHVFFSVWKQKNHFKLNKKHSFKQKQPNKKSDSYFISKDHKITTAYANIWNDSIVSDEVVEIQKTTQTICFHSYLFFMCCLLNERHFMAHSFAYRILNDNLRAFRKCFRLLP